MDTVVNDHLDLSHEELGVLTALLESERTKLLVEIRRTDNRGFREELRHKLALTEGLLSRCHPNRTQAAG
jgi:hypothetical protein